MPTLNTPISRDGFARTELINSLALSAPDGDGDGSLAVGAWDYPGGTSGLGEFLQSRTGICRLVNPGASHSGYANHGLLLTSPPANIRSEAIFRAPDTAPAGGSHSWYVECALNQPFIGLGGGEIQTAYQFQVSGLRFGSVVGWTLYWAQDNFFTGLRYSSSDISITPGDWVKGSLERIGNILYGYVNDTLVVTFDLDNDLTEDSGFSATVGSILTGGYPALDIADWSLAADNPTVEVDQFTVYIADSGCIPSGGGGGGDGGGGNTVTPVFPHSRGAFRTVDAPGSPANRVQAHGQGAYRQLQPMAIHSKGAWRSVGFDTTFVLDPDNPDDPDGPPCPDPGGTIDPLPEPVPFNGVRAFALYNLTKNLLDAYPPFNASISGTNATDISALLAAIAARSYQYWIVPVFRREQVTGGTAKGPYDHPGTLAKLNSYSPFSDPNSGVMPFGIVYDDINCGPCWAGSPPRAPQIDEGCGLFSSIFGIPAAIRLSPILIQRGGYGTPNVRIGIAQYTGPGGYGNAEGFGADYAAFADAQFTAAAAVGLDGVILGMNPYRELVNGWRSPPWTDAFLEEVGTYFAGFGGSMNYGLEMWLGYPPSTRVLTSGTNAAIQAIVAAL